MYIITTKNLNFVSLKNSDRSESTIWGNYEYDRNSLYALFNLV